MYSYVRWDGWSGTYDDHNGYGSSGLERIMVWSGGHKIRWVGWGRLGMGIDMYEDMAREVSYIGRLGWYVGTLELQRGVRVVLVRNGVMIHVEGL